MLGAGLKNMDGYLLDLREEQRKQFLPRCKTFQDDQSKISTLPWEFSVNPLPRWWRNKDSSSFHDVKRSEMIRQKSQLSRGNFWLIIFNVHESGYDAKQDPVEFEFQRTYRLTKQLVTLNFHFTQYVSQFVYIAYHNKGIHQLPQKKFH